MAYPTIELPVRSGTISLPPEYRTFTGSVSVTFHISVGTKATTKSYKNFIGKYPPIQENHDNEVLSDLLTRKYV